jgi:D-alanyl-D-alanine carboxypeptidase
MSFWRRHRTILIIIPVLILVTGIFLWWSDAAERQAAAKLQADQKAYAAQIDQKVKAAIAKQIADAKKAEAEAKAKSAADTAAEKARASANPAGPSAAATNSSCDVTDPTSIRVILNKKHCFVPIDWAPSDLVSVGGYYLRSEAASHISELMSAAANAGVPIEFSSAYRSYANQQATYANWVAVNGSQAAADRVSARPGYSEHQTGLAADLKAGNCYLECFGTTPQYSWLTEHAADYGFIRRYPVGLSSITGYEPEAWHWRYVGVQTAHDMKTRGIETMEQYFGVSGGGYN